MPSCTVYLKSRYPAKTMPKIYRLLTPRKTMDAVEISTDDHGQTWDAVGILNGCQVQRLASFSTFTQCLEYCHEIGCNISKDRYLGTIRK